MPTITSGRKEHLIQAVYHWLHDEHLALSLPLLERERDFKSRLLGVMRALIDVSEPYHRFSGILFQSAADPLSPLNPFSPESEPIRKECMALYDKVLEGSKLRIPTDLRTELPTLLWLYQMAIVLFWIHDNSRGRARTRRLVDSTVDIITRLITLAAMPLMRPLRRSALRLLSELRETQLAR
jgi:hypothetical protein